MIVSTSLPRLLRWSLLLWPLVLFGLTLITHFNWLLAVLIIGGAGFVLMTQPWWCTIGIALFLHTGILTSLQVGFTLKAPQLFALLGCGSLVVNALRQGKWPYPRLTGWPWFAIFFLATLPSLWHTDIYGLDWGSNHTSLRLLLNYLLLYLLAGVVWCTVNTKERLRQVLLWSFVSCALSLGFGLLQQIGYYQGWYDPFEHVGQHSSIVDFYGPFLRFSPGTFANEYGEQLQTTALLLVGCLLVSGWQRWQRVCFGVLFSGVVVALIINFTRASWLVMAGGTFMLWLGAGLRWSKLVLWGSALSAGVYGAFFIASQISMVSQTLMVSVGQRFQELSDVSTQSAGQRLLAWQDAWLAFLEHPLIGNGWGTYIVTHNVPLQLLAEVGLVGCLTFYGMMGWVSWTLWQGWRQAVEPDLKLLQLTFLVAFWGCLAFDMTNHGIFHFVLWWIIALGLVTARLNRQSLQPNP